MALYHIAEQMPLTTKDESRDNGDVEVRGHPPAHLDITIFGSYLIAI
ncbi:hypothetical protein [Ktedonobacter sp. SOSP1-85]|nr:hypothetical protein [Ktedonobacter sp. SOSP1-85]